MTTVNRNAFQAIKQQNIGLVVRDLQVQPLMESYILASII